MAPRLVMKMQKVYICPENSLEFVYEILDKYKDVKSVGEVIESLKKDMRKMICYFKDEKFEKLQRELGWIREKEKHQMLFK